MHLNQRKQRGLTLVESMVALLVISIGLLGIAALQITAMKQNSSALHHSQAVWIGYNMADRIRANISQFAGYAGIDTNNGYSQDCMSGPCNTVELITADAADWATEIRNLPGGRGIISGNATQLVIAVMWDDEGTGTATGTGCDPTNAADLTCYTVTMVQ
ncbi:MAG: type IV pilus modification protein PilV [Gammaproteobacteria bacterium]|nr:type IV pilus modification protein PilV [Gammaproteobacteria bacterium]